MKTFDLKWITLALLIAVCVLSLKSCNQSKEAALDRALQAALNDSVRVYRNQAGQAAASISVIEIDRKGLLETINAKDEMIGKLQAVVAADKNATAAAVFKAEARGRAAGATQIITKTVAFQGVSRPDTAGEKQPCELPTYKAEVKGDGITANVTAGPDSVTIDNYRVEQEFGVTFTSTKGKGLFAKRTKTVVVTALSKNGTVTDVRSFQEPADAPKRGLWAGIGAAVVIALKVAGALLL